MAKEIQQRAKFNIIRYANCWEDADLLLDGLNINEYSNCISIASAGDNSLSLLVKNPNLVVAVDLSVPQIACSELKKYAIKHLEYAEFLQLLGFKPCEKRLDIYRKIQDFLSDESKIFFIENKNIIEEGIIHKGKFEKYFQCFAKKIMPLIHNQKNMTELFLPKSVEAQKIFYDKTWNNWKFKLLFKLFFNKFVMGKLGRDKEFFKYVDAVAISKHIKHRTDTILTTVPTWNNPYLNYILLNNFDFSLPHFAREENFNIIKQNIDKLEIRKGTVNEVLREKNIKFDAFNLSDIFEYMSDDLFKDIAGEMLEYSNKNARFAYWNMLVPRQISQIFPEKIYCLEDLSKKLYDEDKAFFYKAFYIDEVK